MMALVTDVRDPVAALVGVDVGRRERLELVDADGHAGPGLAPP